MCYSAVTPLKCNQPQTNLFYKVTVVTIFVLSHTFLHVPYNFNQSLSYLTIYLCQNHLQQTGLTLPTHFLSYEQQYIFTQHWHNLMFYQTIPCFYYTKLSYKNIQKIYKQEEAIRPIKGCPLLAYYSPLLGGSNSKAHNLVFVKCSQCFKSYYTTWYAITCLLHTFCSKLTYSASIYALLFSLC